MQKLDRREETYTPANTPHICEQGGLVIKHDREVGQVLQDYETPSNNSAVDRSQYRGISDLRVQNVVYTLNMRVMPLMPTTQQRANKLLSRGKAKVVRRSPFTVQLLYAGGEAKQEIVLGLDSGYANIGFSVVSDSKELISGEVVLRKDVSKKISERRMYRRLKRSRLWHRKPGGVDNYLPEGWIAPSLRHKVLTHLNLVSKLKKLLPITKTNIEVATFDTQRMRNPEISGVEYQQGTLYGYEVKEYLLEKWGRRCAYCNKGNRPLEVEHIIPKSRGGSNRVDNLTIACEPCNKAKGSMTADEYDHPELMKRVKKSLRAVSFMNLVRTRIAGKLDCEITYGYVTKYGRTQLGLEKSHANDAFVIAGGNSQARCSTYMVKQIRRNNRCLQLNRCGYKPSIRRQRYKLQPNDTVRFEREEFEVKGMFNYGTYTRLKSNNGDIVNTNVKNIELISYGKGLQFS